MKTAVDRCKGNGKHVTLFIFLKLIFLQGTSGDKGEMGIPGDTGKPVKLI